MNMTVELGILISIVSVISGVIVSWATFAKNASKDIKQETRDETKNKIEMSAKMDVLLSNQTEMKSDVKSIQSKFDKTKDDINDIDKRVAVVETVVENHTERIEKMEKTRKKVSK